ncbi:hypothetical protein BRC81_10810 [Halobacteriales archaeon QS_1_68_20]|nr:MAG: hypothetical protein BRC81_10810 [Halobacteriales archaeon QS_1_68_20]
MSAPSLAGAVEADLAAAIAAVRDDVDPRAAARDLLGRDSGPGLLIGLTDGAERAVYYDGTNWGIRFVGFDEDGVADFAASQTVESCRHRRYAERFVRERATEFAWVHPRFRWVLSETPAGRRGGDRCREPRPRASEPRPPTPER